MAYLWGRHAVLEALRAGREITKLSVAAGAKPVGPLAEALSLARQRHVPIVHVPPTVLDRIAAGVNHQGIVAEAADFRYAALDDLIGQALGTGEPPLLLVLDHLADPQNLGTLLRTLDAVGGHGAIIPRERAAGITPAVSKASAGAVEHLPVAQVVNINRALETLKDRGVWVFGLHPDGSTVYDAVDYRVPLALVVGAEGPGLSRLTRERCDVLVKLPMRGKVASLNAAVAGSIVLYHIFQTRRLTTPPSP